MMEYGTAHRHDIVEGPMANDTIYNYVQDFIDGKVTRAAFWELARFKHPTHQICFCTDRTFKMLAFQNAERRSSMNKENDLFCQSRGYISEYYRAGRILAS